MALGPSGDPYFSTRQDIYRLRGGRPELILHYDGGVASQLDVGAFAFDINGNIYVPNAVTGRIALYDSTGAPLAEAFAFEPSAPTRVFFGRNADGSTNARLFAIDGGKLIELNRRAYARRGYRSSSRRRNSPPLLKPSPSCCAPAVG